MDDVDGRHGGFGRSDPSCAPNDPSIVYAAIFEPCLNASFSVFILTQGEYDAGFMYKCSLMPLNEPQPKTPQQLEKERAEEREATELELIYDRLKTMRPLVAQRIRDSNDSPMPSWKFSLSGKRVVMGFENGLMRVQMLTKPFDFSSMDAFWTYAYQDNDRGKVHRVQLTFDDR